MYKHPLISNSFYFPELLNFSIHGNDLRLRLRAVIPLSEYIEMNYATFEADKNTKISRELIHKIFFDLIQSLRVLHAAGYVHSDISPMNVGFNQSTDTWQLFDFDQSMRITESLTCPRQGGTIGFKSKHFADTGIFLPSDDLISLFKTCSFGLRKFLNWTQCFIELTSALELIAPSATQTQLEAETQMVEILKVNEKCNF